MIHRSNYAELLPGMVQELCDLEAGLSDWEADFIDSIQDQIEEKGVMGLTERQAQKIEDVYRKRMR